MRQGRAAIHRKLQLRFGGAFCVPTMIGSVEVEVLYPAARSRVGTITGLAKLYREARRGEIDPYQAIRLPSVLTGLRSALEARAFERRLDALEARFAAGERPGLKVVR